MDVDLTDSKAQPKIDIDVDVDDIASPVGAATAEELRLADGTRSKLNAAPRPRTALPPPIPRAARGTAAPRPSKPVLVQPRASAEMMASWQVNPEAPLVKVDAAERAVGEAVSEQVRADAAKLGEAIAKAKMPPPIPAAARSPGASKVMTAVQPPPHGPPVPAKPALVVTGNAPHRESIPSLATTTAATGADVADLPQWPTLAAPTVSPDVVTSAPRVRATQANPNPSAPSALDGSDAWVFDEEYEERQVDGEVVPTTYFERVEDEPARRGRARLLIAIGGAAAALAVIVAIAMHGATPASPGASTGRARSADGTAVGSTGPARLAEAALPDGSAVRSTGPAPLAEGALPDGSAVRSTRPARPAEGALPDGSAVGSTRPARLAEAALPDGSAVGSPSSDGTPVAATTTAVPTAAPPVAAAVAENVATPSKVATSLTTLPITSSPAGATVTLVDNGNAVVLGRTPVSAALDPSHSYDVVLAGVNRPTVVKHVDLATMHQLAVELPAESAASAAPAARASAAPAQASAAPAQASAAPAAQASAAPASVSAAQAPAAQVPAAASHHHHHHSVAAVETHSAPTGKLVTPSFDSTETSGSAASPGRSSVAPKQVAVADGNGVLMVSAKPPCEIYVDGKPTHLVTPQRSLAVPAGQHSITLVNMQLGVKKTIAVKVEANKPTKLIQDFTKG